MKKKVDLAEKLSQESELESTQISSNYEKEKVLMKQKIIFLEKSLKELESNNTKSNLKNSKTYSTVSNEDLINNKQKKEKLENEIKRLNKAIKDLQEKNIEYEELIRALSDRQKLLSNKNLGEAFKFFDKDNNGFITWNEIAEIIYPEGKIPENIMKEFLDEIGQNDEHMKIDFYDFKRILTK